MRELGNNTHHPQHRASERAHALRRQDTTRRRQRRRRQRRRRTSPAHSLEPLQEANFGREFAAENPIGLQQPRARLQVVWEICAPSLDRPIAASGRPDEALTYAELLRSHSNGVELASERQYQFD